MKTITLEEHFVTKDFLKATGAGDDPVLKRLEDKLLDLGAGRIAAMDEGGIDLQFLSLAAIGLEALHAGKATDVCRDANDELAAAVAAQPDRLQGFAALGMKAPKEAAKELERCVHKLGFLGPLVNGTVDDGSEASFLDADRYLPFWEAAAALKVPVYLHPAPPVKAVQRAYYSGLSEPLGMLLSIAGWGWHAETALHTLRLVCSGLFDRLPDLQVVIGHMGEGLPPALARCSSVLSGPASLRQPVADYFKTNLHLTTSGYFTLPPFECARLVVGIDRMMYSVDYPFSSNLQGQSYLKMLGTVLEPAQMEALTHGNAEKLFGLA